NHYTLSLHDALPISGDLDEGKIQKELAIIEKRLSQKAQNLHEQREKIARDLEEKIKKELADLYMEKARFSIRINETNSFTKLGTDRKSTRLNSSHVS